MHVWLTGKPGSTLCVKGGIWQARLENGGGVVIPEFGHHDKCIQRTIRQDAEVANPDREACQEFVENPIQAVK